MKDKNDILKAPITDFALLAARKGCCLPKGLQKMTLTKVRELVSHPNNLPPGIGKKKLELIRAVLTEAVGPDDGTATQHLSGTVVEYLDDLIARLTNSISQLASLKVEDIDCIREFMQSSVHEFPIQSNDQKKTVIKQYFLEPDATLESVGNLLGITKQRVEQIISSIFEPLVIAQSDGTELAEKLQDFYQWLILHGVKMQELRNLKRFIKYATSETAQEVIECSKGDLTDLAQSFLEEQDEAGAFPSSVHEFRQYLSMMLDLSIPDEYHLDHLANCKGIQIGKLNGNTVFVHKYTADRIRLLLLQHPDGLTAGEIASRLNKAPGVVGGALANNVGHFWRLDGDRRYRPLQTPIADWMPQAFKTTAKYMQTKGLLDLPLDEFLNAMCEANKGMGCESELKKHTSSRELALYALRDSQRLFEKTGRMRIGLTGQNGNVGVRGVLIEGANQLGYAFLKEELWEKVKERFPNRGSFDMALRNYNGKLFQRKEYRGLLGLRFICNLDATAASCGPTQRLIEHMTTIRETVQGWNAPTLMQKFQKAYAEAKIEL